MIVTDVLPQLYAQFLLLFSAHILPKERHWSFAGKHVAPISVWTRRHIWCESNGVVRHLLWCFVCENKQRTTRQRLHIVVGRIAPSHHPKPAGWNVSRDRNRWTCADERWCSLPRNRPDLCGKYATGMWWESLASAMAETGKNVGSWYLVLLLWVWGSSETRAMWSHAYSPFLLQLKDKASEHNLPVHMDGARVMNAVVALNVKPSDVLQHVDSVSMCFSKVLMGA